MDEGWVEFNAGQRAEDKWCAQSRVIPAQAGIQLARDARNKNWTPAFAGVTRMLAARIEVLAAGTMRK